MPWRAWRFESMNTRTRTIASFFSVAMAAMLLGAVVTTQIQPQTAMARPAEPDPAAAPPRCRGRRARHPGHLPGHRPAADRRRREHQHQEASCAVARRHRPVPRLLRRRLHGPLLRAPGPGRRRRRATPQTQRSLGSGFIVDKDGLHPHQPPRRSRARTRSRSRSASGKRLRGQAGRQGRAHRRGAAEDRAQGAAHRARTSATPTRPRSASGSWPSATRSAWAGTA